MEGIPSLEASDVATAIYDAVNAVTLPVESAAGQFPPEGAEVVHRLIRRTKAHDSYTRSTASSGEEAAEPANAIAGAGAALACGLGARCIVAYSADGATDYFVSARWLHLFLYSY